jgi:hypothetical protein
LKGIVHFFCQGKKKTTKREIFLKGRERRKVFNFKGDLCESGFLAVNLLKSEDGGNGEDSASRVEHAKETRVESREFSLGFFFLQRSAAEDRLPHQPCSTRIM